MSRSSKNRQAALVDALQENPRYEVPDYPAFGTYQEPVESTGWDLVDATSGEPSLDHPDLDPTNDESLIDLTVLDQNLSDDLMTLNHPDLNVTTFQEESSESFENGPPNSDQNLVEVPTQTEAAPPVIVIRYGYFLSTDRITILTQKNPKRGASKLRYDCYVDGGTVADYFRNVLTNLGDAQQKKCHGDLRWDIGETSGSKNNLICVERYNETTEHWDVVTEAGLVAD